MALLAALAAPLALAAADAEVTGTYLKNPSFEQGMQDWTNSGMQTQTNSYFSIKDGKAFAEAWVDRGNKLPDVSVSQTLTGLQPGKYRMTAATLHIQQDKANSAQNAGDPQTGGFIFADSKAAPIDTMKERSLEFMVLGTEATIGARTSGSTANWICVDNFRLYYLGALTDADYLAALNDKIAYAESDILPLRMQNTCRQAMTAALAEAKALAANPGSDVATKVKAMIEKLDSAIADCQASAARYSALEARIAHAQKVMEWIAGNDEKTAALQAAINAANAKLNDFTLTDAQLQEAIDALNTAIRQADKEIYAPSWSLGDINNPDNAWYVGRTIESKNWILFWEKPYGDEVPVNFSCGNHRVNAWETIEHAQIAFDFYTDSLKFINRATSKTNQYKMVIKLRYSESEWEATGSGVDDTIGLLTLTPWAQTSRNWQTLYHEIGHCFQYQTHCDNGNQNGWMYPIGNGCAFWEQCAQWQAYKIMPTDQFNNEWYNGYLESAHKHILHEGPRYNNFMVQDYWTMLHGWDFVGRLWNESEKPEDAIQAYQRITNISNDEFNDEMWDCAARFATWDIPHFEPYHKNSWTKRKQTKMNKGENGFFVVDSLVAVENTGYNIIQLNAPSEGCLVSAAFQGLAGDPRFRTSRYNSRAGWRYGFVALLKDGTRVYGEPGSKAVYAEQTDTVYFECPADCDRLWFVVTGAATKYRQHAWDNVDQNDEHYGYSLKFHNTNLLGEANGQFDSLESIAADVKACVPAGVYTLTGAKVRDDGDTSGLAPGVYIVNGKKTMILP